MAAPYTLTAIEDIPLSGKVKNFILSFAFVLLFLVPFGVSLDRYLNFFSLSRLL